MRILWFFGRSRRDLMHIPRPHQIIDRSQLEQGLRSALSLTPKNFTLLVVIVRAQAESPAIVSAIDVLIVVFSRQGMAILRCAGLPLRRPGEMEAEVKSLHARRRPSRASFTARQG